MGAVRKKDQLKAAWYYVKEGMNLTESAMKAGLCKTKGSTSQAMKRPVVQAEIARLNKLEDEKEIEAKELKVQSLKSKGDKVEILENLLLDKLIELQRKGEGLGADDKLQINYLSKFHKIGHDVGLRSDRLQGHNVSEKENPSNTQNKIYSDMFKAASEGKYIKDADEQYTEDEIDEYIELEDGDETE